MAGPRTPPGAGVQDQPRDLSERSGASTLKKKTVGPATTTKRRPAQKRPTKTVEPTTAPDGPSLRGVFVAHRILEAAEGVFSKTAVDQVRAEDLMQAAGVSRRTFYKYYRSKEDVLLGLYALVTGKLIELLEGGGGLMSLSLDAVHLAIEAYLEFQVSNGRLLLHFISEGLRPGSALFERRLWFQGRLVLALDRLVQETTGRKLPGPVFVAMLSSLEGLSMYLLSGERSPEELATTRQLAHAIADSVLGTGGVERIVLPEC